MNYFQTRMREIKSSGIVTERMKNVVKQKGRKGQDVYYFRIGKGRRIRLPDPSIVGDEQFMRAYSEALSGKKAPPSLRGVAPKVFGPLGKPGYVYFVKHKHQVKIGFSLYPRSRVKAIQVSCSDPVELLMVMPGTNETERFFHELFRDYRVGGEWFNLIGLLADFVGHKPV